MRGALVAAVLLAVALLPAAPARADSDVPALAWGNDFACVADAAHPRPVVLLHGLGASAASNWSYVGPALAADGHCVFALTYGMDPRTRFLPFRPGGTIAAQDSAREIAAFVARVLRATGARTVDFVGHSEGTVTPRWYLERLGGASKVRTYVALTPLWRGTAVGGGGEFGGLVSALCAFCTQAAAGSAYLEDLNADGERIPGIRHLNIVTRYDQVVVPFTSGVMRDGGRNVVLQDVCPLDAAGHADVAFDPVALTLIRNALAPGDARLVSCGP